MDIFKLPQTTKVNKLIPKNSFDNYTSAKQKRLIADLIARISWLHKISTETVNLPARDIKEIQVFRIELKQRDDVQKVLDIIDKSIPYIIIFIIDFEDMIYISTSSKHPHPTNENSSVIDWTFKTEWFHPAENKFLIHLKKDIDAVYFNFLVQLSEVPSFVVESIQGIISYKKNENTLKKEISKLKQEIANCKQFNKKVELNLNLKGLEEKLNKFYVLAKTLSESRAIT